MRRVVEGQMLTQHVTSEIRQAALRAVVFAAAQDGSRHRAERRLDRGVARCYHHGAAVEALQSELRVSCRCVAADDCKRTR